ncbi:hypothetical protein [Alloactinosynnema sp. L-07]|uniref:DUF6875 domain-containing protein n=1 Tax=Alloactinosynnema sp. L-07 TaxID=1653480 RepID=UPI00065EFF2F|nr:hypothetical protein [Alloactinosynnema sp. L-07]CRK56718.1 hypothetical protein [Alloactinosynnema sp. L-07]
MSIDHALVLVEDWLGTYITRPHSLIGRPGPVCPFVEPAQRMGSLETRVRLVGSSPSAALMTELMRCALDEFDDIEWKASNPNLHALLVVLPDLARDSLEVLDQAHAAVKSESVHRGMMIGQFHQDCDEVAARNPDFAVSRSPVPLFAIRSMAVHDVLFLSGREDWFMVYATRFGSRYWKGARGVDPVLVTQFDKACAAYGIQPPAVAT